METKPQFPMSDPLREMILHDVPQSYFLHRMEKSKEEIRREIATAAMQGLMTKDYVKLHIDGEDAQRSGYTNLKMVAEMSVQMADALLAELENK